MVGAMSDALASSKAVSSIDTVQQPPEYTIEWVRTFHAQLLSASMDLHTGLRTVLPSSTLKAILQSVTALLESEPTLVKVRVLWDLRTFACNHGSHLAWFEQPERQACRQVGR